MIRLKGSIIFRLWLPFALLLLLLSVGIATYYPYRQKQVITANKQEILEKTARTVALGVEFSLNAEDFSGLSRTYNFVRSDSAFDFIAIITVDSIKKSSELLSVFPDTLSLKPLELSNEEYLYEDVPFKTDMLQGFVRVGVNKSKLEQELIAINKPAFIAILLIFLLYISLIFYIVQVVTKPLMQLAGAIGKKEISEVEIIKIIDLSYGEVRLLAENFLMLIRRVENEKSENENILNNLDLIVRKRTAELEDAKTKLINAQRMAGIGSFEYFPQSERFDCSESMPEIFGILEEKNLSGFISRLDDDSKNKVLRFFKYHKQGEQLDEIICFKNNNKDIVQWARLLCHSSIGKDGAPYFTGTIQDITRQHEADEQIVKLSLVAQYTSNCVIITDHHKKIIWANESLLNLTGFTLEEIIGNTPRMFQFEKTDQATINMINDHLSRSEAVHNVEILNRGKHGNEYWLDVNIVAIRNKSGNIMGYIAVETDITARKKMEDSLRSLNKELEQKVNEKTQNYLELTRAYNEQEKLAVIGEVAAGVAHDLNTPISTILIGTESVEKIIHGLLEEELISFSASDIKYACQVARSIVPEVYISGSQLEKEKIQIRNLLSGLNSISPEEQELIIDRLVRCRIKSEEMINELLKKTNVVSLLVLIEKIQTVYNITSTISNAASKSSTVIRNLREHITKKDITVKRKINLYGSVVSALNIFSYSTQGRIRIEPHIPPDIQIMGNEIKLFQLWSNLIKNAIEAMESTPNPVLKINALKNGKHVYISFENNGPQIPPDVINTLFSRFYSTKLSSGGSGLGLNIVQNVVKEHGGEIKIRSDEKTTVFILKFPASAAETAG